MLMIACPASALAPMRFSVSSSVLPADMTGHVLPIAMAEAVSSR
jgi:hypothetical protein